MTLDQLLRENRTELIKRARAKVGGRSAPAASTTELEHGVPLFLSQLSATLEDQGLGGTDHSARASHTAHPTIGESAAMHGRDLLKFGFTIEQVVHDYGDVCQAVTELAEERGATLSIAEFHTLNRCLDNAIAGAVSSWSQERDQNSGKSLATAVTDLKKALEETKRYLLLVEAVEDYAIFVLDPKGCVTTWNLGAARIKGYTAAEILGRHFSVFHTPEDVAAGKCEQGLDVAGRKGRFADEGWRVRKDGSRLWANVVITAMRSESGNLVGFAKVTRDLTERVRNEEQRLHLAAESAAREAKATAETTQRVQREFLAKAGEALTASSLDYRMTLATVARLAVPELADWCSVELLEPGATVPLQVR